MPTRRDPRLDSGEPLDASHGLTTIGGRGAYLALFSQIGIMLLVSMLGGALLGNAVDRELGTRPIFLVVGFAGGTVVGTVGVARTVARALARFDALEASANAERLRRRIASEKERRER